MSLLLKDVDAISHLSLYDVRGTPGVAADLGHINTKAKVRVPRVVFRACAAPRPLR
jgi:malate dehydrogenase